MVAGGCSLLELWAMESRRQSWFWQELWPVGDTHWRRCVLKDRMFWERTILGQGRSVRKEQQREIVMNTTATIPFLPAQLGQGDVQ